MEPVVVLLHDWRLFLAGLVIFGVAPGLVLRVVVRAYPQNHPRRRELIAELYAMDYVKRPLFVAQQLETALSDGIPARWRERQARRGRTAGSIRVQLRLWLADARPSLREWSNKRSVSRYRRTVAKRLELLPKFEVPVALRLRDGYVPLTDGAGRDLGAALGRSRRLLILGPPGSGKSLFLRYTLWSICAAPEMRPSARWWRRRRHQRLSGDLLPVHIPLARLGAVEDVSSLLAESFEGFNVPDGRRLATRELSRRSSRLLVLFDGLDEVSASQRPMAVRMIADFALQHPTIRFVVTSRTEAYGGYLDDVVDEILRIEPLTDEAVNRFLLNRPAMIDLETARRLVAALEESPDVARLARSPLLLALLAHLYCDSPTGRLPANRTGFFRDVSELLLRSWQGRHNKFPGHVKLAALQRLALLSHDHASRSISLSYEWIRQEIHTVLVRFDRRLSETELLDEIVEGSGILVRIDGGESFQFVHRALREYFAAVGLADQPDELLRRYRLDPTAWSEVVRLWCGGQHDSTDLIRAIADEDPALALDCLATARRVEPSFAKALVERFGQSDERAPQQPRFQHHAPTRP